MSGYVWTTGKYPETTEPVRKQAAWGDLLDIVGRNIVKRSYIWGPPGIGKSHVALEVLRKTYTDKVFQCTVNEDVSVQELLGHYIPKGGDFVWHEGPVALAMRYGALIVNELPRASGAVRDLMLAVLDDPKVCTIALPTGETLKPHAGFAVIATGNDKPEDCLTEALNDRFNIIVHLQVPNPALVAYLNSLLSMAGTLVERSYYSETRQVSPRRMLSFIELRTGGISDDVAATAAFGEAYGAEIIRTLRILNEKVA